MKGVIVVRIVVTKPTEGTVDIRVDDRYGATGLLLKAAGVPVTEVTEAVKPLLEEWEKRRKAVKAAKKGDVA